MQGRKTKLVIFGPRKVIERLDALRLTPDEARWRVLERLLNEHENGMRECARRPEGATA